MATITFYTNAEVDEALAELAECDDQARSEVIRLAILSARRARRAQRLREESSALAADAADRAEAQAVLADMEAL